MDGKLIKFTKPYHLFFFSAENNKILIILAWSFELVIKNGQTTRVKIAFAVLSENNTNCIRQRDQKTGSRLMCVHRKSFSQIWFDFD
jgi:hypothetical protein